MGTNRARDTHTSLLLPFTPAKRAALPHLAAIAAAIAAAATTARIAPAASRQVAHQSSLSVSLSLLLTDRLTFLLSSSVRCRRRFSFGSPRSPTGSWPQSMLLARTCRPERCFNSPVLCMLHV